MIRDWHPHACRGGTRSVRVSEPKRPVDRGGNSPGRGLRIATVTRTAGANAGAGASPIGSARSGFDRTLCLSRDGAHLAGYSLAVLQGKAVRASNRRAAGPRPLATEIRDETEDPLRHLLSGRDHHLPE